MRELTTLLIAMAGIVTAALMPPGWAAILLWGALRSRCAAALKWPATSRVQRRSSDHRLQPQWRARRSRSCLTFMPVWVGAALLGTAYGAGWLELASGAEAASDGRVRTHFSMCFVGGGYNCVVDGDTIWLRGVKIRIADIDAPETHDPRCASEKALGDRATVRLQQLLNASVVTLETIDRDRDRYGRALRIVDVDGHSVGSILVAEGLAREWDGARHPWC